MSKYQELYNLLNALCNKTFNVVDHTLPQDAYRETSITYYYLDQLRQKLSVVKNANAMIQERCAIECIKRIKQLLADRHLLFAQYGYLYFNAPSAYINQVCTGLANLIADEMAVCQILSPDVRASVTQYESQTLKMNTEEDGEFKPWQYIQSTIDKRLLPIIDIFDYAHNEPYKLFEPRNSDENIFGVFNLSFDDLLHLCSVAGKPSETYYDTLYQYYLDGNNTLLGALRTFADAVSASSKKGQGSEKLANLVPLYEPLKTFFGIWFSLTPKNREIVAALTIHFGNQRILRITLNSILIYYLSTLEKILDASSDEVEIVAQREIFLTMGDVKGEIETLRARISEAEIDEVMTAQYFPCTEILSNTLNEFCASPNSQSVLRDVRLDGASSSNINLNILRANFESELKARKYNSKYVDSINVDEYQARLRLFQKLSKVYFRGLSHRDAIFSQNISCEDFFHLLPLIPELMSGSVPLLDIPLFILNMIQFKLEPFRTVTEIKQLYQRCVQVFEDRQNFEASDCEKILDSLIDNAFSSPLQFNAFYDFSKTCLTSEKRQSIIDRYLYSIKLLIKEYDHFHLLISLLDEKDNICLIEPSRCAKVKLVENSYDVIKRLFSECFVGGSEYADIAIYSLKIRKYFSLLNSVFSGTATNYYIHFPLVWINDLGSIQQSHNHEYEFSSAMFPVPPYFFRFIYTFEQIESFLTCKAISFDNIKAARFLSSRVPAIYHAFKTGRQLLQFLKWEGNDHKSLFNDETIKFFLEINYENLLKQSSLGRLTFTLSDIVSLIKVFPVSYHESFMKHLYELKFFEGNIPIPLLNAFINCLEPTLLAHYLLTDFDGFITRIGSYYPPNYVFDNLIKRKVLDELTIPLNSFLALLPQIQGKYTDGRKRRLHLCEIFKANLIKSASLVPLSEPVLKAINNYMTADMIATLSPCFDLKSIQTTKDLLHISKFFHGAPDVFFHILQQQGYQIFQHAVKNKAVFDILDELYDYIKRNYTIIEGGEKNLIDFAHTIKPILLSMNCEEKESFVRNAPRFSYRMMPHIIDDLYDLVLLPQVSHVIGLNKILDWMVQEDISEGFARYFKAEIFRYLIAQIEAGADVRNYLRMMFLKILLRFEDEHPLSRVLINGNAFIDENVLRNQAAKIRKILLAVSEQTDADAPIASRLTNIFNHYAYHNHSQWFMRREHRHPLAENVAKKIELSLFVNQELPLERLSEARCFGIIKSVFDDVREEINCDSTLWGLYCVLQEGIPKLGDSSKYRVKAAKRVEHRH